MSRTSRRRERKRRRGRELGVEPDRSAWSEPLRADDETSIRRRRLVAVFAWREIRWLVVYCAIFSIVPWFFASRASLGDGLSGATRTTSGTVTHVERSDVSEGRGRKTMRVHYSFTDDAGTTHTGTSYTKTPPAVGSTIRVTHELSNPARSVADDMQPSPLGPIAYAVFLWPVFIVFQLRRRWTSLAASALRHPTDADYHQTVRRLWVLGAGLLALNAASAVIFFSLAA
jgi:hypothetical protein